MPLPTYGNINIGSRSVLVPSGIRNHDVSGRVHGESVAILIAFRLRHDETRYDTSYLNSITVITCISKCFLNLKFQKLGYRSIVTSLRARQCGVRISGGSRSLSVL